MTGLVAAFYTAEDGKYTWLMFKQEGINIGGPRRMIVEDRWTWTINN